MKHWMWHFHDTFSMFQWRQRAARQLWHMGRKREAKELLGVNEERLRRDHDKQARIARRRAERHRTFMGRVLNIINF